MTKQELNRDIKRLGADICRMSELYSNDPDTYFKYLEKVSRPEFIRIYHADSNFEYMNLNSIKLMLRLNLKHRFVALHRFGLSINEKELI